MKREKQQTYRRIKWNKQLVSVAAGMILLTQLGAGSLPAFAAENMENQPVVKALTKYQPLLALAQNNLPTEQIDGEVNVSTVNELQAEIDKVAAGDSKTIVITRTISVTAISEQVTIKGQRITLKSESGEKNTIGITKPLECNIISVGASDDGNTRGSLTLENVVINGNNYASGSALVAANNSTVIVSNSTIKNGMRNGDLSGVNGKGIYATNNAEVNINAGSLLTNNRFATYGGAIYAQGGSKVNLNGGTINGNRANYGGGIFVSGSGSLLTMNSGTVSNNAATGGGEVGIGGGLSAGYSANMVIRGGIIRDNSASNVGGGIRIQGVSSLEMTGGVLSGNTATTSGSGIYASDSSKMNITSGTIYGKAAAAADLIRDESTNASTNGIKGNALLIAKSDTATHYEPGDTTGLIMGYPTGSNNPTAAWVRQGTEYGISYQNGSNSGFLPVTGVTVGQIPVPAGTLSISANLSYNGEGQAISAANISGYDAASFGEINEISYAPENSSSFSRTLPVEAGKYKVKIKTAGGNVYEAFNGEVGTFEIAKKDVTVTIGNVSVLVGTSASQLPTPTISYSGFVLNHTEDSVFGTKPTARYADGATDHAGTSAISFASEGTLTNENYQVTYRPGTLTVQGQAFPADRLNFNVPTGNIYSGSAQGVETPTISNNTNPAEFGNIVVTYAKAGTTDFQSEAPTDAGDYQVKVNVIGGTKYSPYETIKNYTIAKKSVTVKVDDVIVDQGDNLPTPTITYGEFIGNDHAGNVFNDGQQPSGSYQGNSQTPGSSSIEIVAGTLNDTNGANYVMDYRNGNGTLTVIEDLTNTDPGPDPDPDPEADRVPLYRVYNRNNGEHLYTKSQAEAQGLISVGWTNEGIGWYGGESQGHAVYRLYNAASGEHFYTLDEGEYNSVAAAGWNKEGIAFYSADDTGIPIYRLFNPNARDAGSHHFTTEKAENDWLVTVGWRAEIVAFYGK